MVEALKNPTKIELLFRASENGFKASAFHEKCDNIEDTLVLVHNEKGRSFGGFTHFPWQTPIGDNFYVEDLQRRAFIFSLDMMEKFDPVTNFTIVRSRDYGPAFGNNKELDFKVTDLCNKKYHESVSIFPANYNRGMNKL